MTLWIKKTESLDVVLMLLTEKQKQKTDKHIADWKENCKHMSQNITKTHTQTLALDLEDYHPSVLLHCWLGHLTCKIVSKMTYNVLSGTLNPTI